MADFTVSTPIDTFMQSATQVAAAGNLGFVTTAAQTYTLPTTSATLARTDAAQSFTGIQTILGTSTLKFGATAAATIGVSADTTAGVLTFTAPSAGSFSFGAGSISVGGTAFSFGALPSGATTSGPVLTMPATAYTVTGTNTATAFQANYFGAPTFTNASAGTITDAFNTNLVGPPVAGGSQIITRAHTLGVLDSTSASSSITGGLVVATAYGTAATSVGIGAGNVWAGNISAAAIFRVTGNGAANAPVINFTNNTTSGFWISGNDVMVSVNGAQVADFGASTFTLGSSVGLSVPGATTLTGALTQTAKTTTYNGIATQGNGIPAIVKKTRVTAQSAANASICTYTTPAADGSYEVSANMNVTASTTLTTTLTCTYTDESNTARSLILPVTGLTGSFIALGAISGAGASVWETPVMHIRCKASTAITILTSAGTFSGVTYTAEGLIKQTD